MAKRKQEKKGESYERYKESHRAIEAEKSRVGRDIGDIPPIRNHKRRAKSEAHLQAFCETYFPQSFALKWSNDHLEVLATLERVIRDGGNYAEAMPRGSGKTTMVEAGAAWAMLYGLRRFIVPIGATKELAAAILDSIKMELSNNQLLLEDFPEAVYPIHCLEGITQRCTGQLHNGEQTRIVWRPSWIVMPTIAGSRCSGAIVRVAGMNGAIRGIKIKRTDGEPLRPDLVILDDPQTDKSARSIDECNKREALITGAVLGLAGPGKRIAAVMPCTVVRKGDLADRFLDRKVHPEWQGKRYKLIYKLPTDEKSWQEYAEARAEGMRNDDGGKAGNDFYAARREQMDKGAVVAWPERFNEDELSAVQNAMNLKIANEAAFYAEYQNEPQDDRLTDVEELTVEQICAKANVMKRGIVPAGMTHLVAFVDVQKNLLYYTVLATSDRFDGQVVDYGSYPDQQTHYFTYRKAQRTLKRAKAGVGDDGAVYAGMEALADQLLGCEWKSSTGTVLRIERMLIDSGWNSDLIHRFCRESKHAALLIPSKGMAVTAAMKAMSEYEKRPGDRVGVSWRMPGHVPKGGVRHVVYDPNHWKSFTHARFTTAKGDAGCLQLHAGTPSLHRMFAEHVTAEFPTKTQGRGRELNEWRIKPGRSDNHLLDCLAGCMVAASMSGCSLVGIGTAVNAKKKKLSLAALQAKKRNQGRLP